MTWVALRSAAWRVLTKTQPFLVPCIWTSKRLQSIWKRRPDRSIRETSVLMCIRIYHLDPQRPRVQTLHSYPCLERFARFRWQDSDSRRQGRVRVGRVHNHGKGDAGQNAYSHTWEWDVAYTDTASSWRTGEYTCDGIVKLSMVELSMVKLSITVFLLVETRLVPSDMATSTSWECRLTSPLCRDCLKMWKSRNSPLPYNCGKLLKARRIYTHTVYNIKDHTTYWRTVVKCYCTPNTRPRTTIPCLPVDSVYNAVYIHSCTTTSLNPVPVDELNYDEYLD